MEILFIGLVLWVCASYIIADLLPAVILLAVYIVRFLWLCVWETVKALGKAAWWAVTGAAAGAAWLYAQAALFTAILIEELRNGAAPESEAGAGSADDEDDGGDDDEERPSDYDAALALLGLSEPFTREELKRVYRAAMKAAHTDVGGTKEAAQALNAARDLVMKARAWI